jgi:glycosyltransferase involved in cell wall biosynthesis
MKILHVVQGYWPAIGGTELLIKGVSERLVALFGDEVTVFAANGYTCEAFYDPTRPLLPVGQETINGVTVRRFGVFNLLGPVLRLVQGVANLAHLPYRDYLRTLYGGPIIFGLTRAIADFRGDVVAASSFPLMHMYYVSKAQKLSGLPLVFHGGLHPEDKWGYDRPMIYKAIEQADRYIANTTYERDYLIGKGIEARKIEVIGVGVEAERFASADGSSLRERYGLNDEPLVAFVGQQARRKGVDTLLWAMKEIWTQRPEARLLIAGGRTNFSARLDHIIDGFEPAERERIIIIDNFQEEEKADIFAACHLLAFPSAYESFGIPFIEAWAAAKPVVGCRTGAIPSLVEEGVDGLRVPYGDVAGLATAILRLLQDHRLREELGRRGREKVLANYTWDVVAGRYRAVYEKAQENAKMKA